MNAKRRRKCQACSAISADQAAKASVERDPQPPGHPQPADLGAGPTTPPASAKPVGSPPSSWSPAGGLGTNAKSPLPGLPVQPADEPISPGDGSLDQYYYNLRGWALAFARSLGVPDPEATFHDAVLSLLPTCPIQAVRFGPLLRIRLRCRCASAYRSERRLEERHRELAVTLDLVSTPDSTDPYSAEQHERLNEALGVLSSVERQVLYLYYREGFSLDAIATLLQMPVGTVKSHSCRARCRLRARLRRVGSLA